MADQTAFPVILLKPSSLDPSRQVSGSAEGEKIASHSFDVSLRILLHFRNVGFKDPSTLPDPSHLVVTARNEDTSVVQ